MRPLALLLSAALLALSLFATADAGAAKKRRSKLWATVNVCDTKAHPNAIGIRASMPGTGVRRQRMYMRIQVQFFRASDGKWHDLGSDGDSGFFTVGSARFRRREAGRTFTLGTPPAGSQYRLRGAVTFEWRRGDEVVRRAKRITKGGHRGTSGSDPKGFSAAECRVLP